eukprot:CAMPEP_0196753472 /NCGR_PEP_ID=MMETSP1091-20130531/90887_1 /TAXON_ID=302021 /ORGANISM="Rhodomonas sp., Strain CCMP768" /LENGTH=102 /DNA_ID=CAMNT_0042101597 /DNA_START=42 /DNA_END=350 /DNA_ORIENTATION=+
MTGDVLKLGCVILVGLVLLMSYMQDLPGLPASSTRHENHAGRVRSHQLNLMGDLGVTAPPDDANSTDRNSDATRPLLPTAEEAAEERAAQAPRTTASPLSAR